MQNEKLVLLDGEFEVLHVFEVLFQLRTNLLQIFKTLGHFLGELTDGIGRAQTCYDVFALCINEIFAVEQFLAVGGVAREGNACRAVVASIAEYHSLNIHSRAPFGRDTVFLAIQDGALISPGAEYGAYRAPQLLHNILGECTPRALTD